MPEQRFTVDEIVSFSRVIEGKSLLNPDVSKIVVEFGNCQFFNDFWLDVLGQKSGIWSN